MDRATAAGRALARQRQAKACPALVIGLALLGAAIALACGEGSGDANRSLYLALGDSLSEGIGASSPDANGFVPLVHQGLGEGVESLNLGHSGDTSQDLLDHGHLDEAVDEIEERNGDAEETNDVRLVTLEIGGNDLLRLYFSLVQTRVCPDLETALEKPECSDALAAALEGFQPNLAAALDRLRQADPELPIVLLTLYNPFGHLPGTAELGELSLEGRPDTPFPEGLNDIIRAQAEQRDGIVLVDLYPLFEGRSQQLIAGDFIHPNDEGYRVMAEAVLEAIENLP